ncbi:MAG: hypothetical protein ACP5QP_05895 [Brevinematia bacterium]
MFWATFVLAVIVSIFFLIKREIFYSVVVMVLLVVSIPLYFYLESIEKKSKNVVLYLDYSQSSFSKLKKFEKKLKNLNFDFIRYFGRPFNKDTDFDSLSSDEINVIVSDFLFDIPSKLTNNKNNILVSLGSNVITNHLIKSVSITNVSQIDYLYIEMIFPSPITVKDIKGKVLFKSNNRNFYFIPLNSLPSEVFLVSLNTNILFNLGFKKKLGIVWFEPNQDLTKLLRVLKSMNYTYDLFIKFNKNFSYKEYEYMIFGYPDVSFEELIKRTLTNSRCVVISPSEMLLNDVISFSKLSNVQFSKNDFYYLDSLGIFDFSFSYPVNFSEVYKFSFPKISSKVYTLDRLGVSLYMEVFGREFLFFNARYIYKVDAENYKLGIYSTFSEDLFTEMVRFLFKDGNIEGVREINFSESAFDGARMFDGAVSIENLNNDFIDKLRKTYLQENVVSKKFDFSSFWWLMVLVIIGFTVKWLVRG